MRRLIESASSGGSPGGSHYALWHDELETADRKTADGKLAEWPGDLKRVDLGNRDMTLAMLLEKYVLAQTDIAHSTQVGEGGVPPDTDRFVVG